MNLHKLNDFIAEMHLKLTSAGVTYCRHVMTGPVIITGHYWSIGAQLKWLIGSISHRHTNV